ncbi:MAG TPA: TIM-barrel domain-containing protein [Anaerolineae bacterium]
MLIAGLVAVTALQASTASAKPLAARYVQPSAWTLGPIEGWHGLEPDVNYILDRVDLYGIPISTFHFDSYNWEVCNNNGQYNFSQSLIDRLKSKNRRALFWIVPLISTNCPEYNTALINNWFVRDSNGNVIVTTNWEGSGSWIDFYNSAAVDYWHSLLNVVINQTYGAFGGFYIDEVRPDLNYDPSYGNLFAQDLLDYTRANIPDGDVVMKRYGKNTPGDDFLSYYAHISYLNDTTTDFGGLMDGINRLFQSAPLIPAAFNEYSGYSDDIPDSETYIRRAHFGALQPVMEHDPLAWSFPWDGFYSPQVLTSVVYYSNLHAELVPYLHSYDEAAYETNQPILRSINAANYSTALGNEIYVKYITGYTTTADVALPAGQWIDYWNEGMLYPGGVTMTVGAPLGREPIFIANGALIPTRVITDVTGHGTSAAAQSLTVNVFPNGQSTFRYFDTNNNWLTLSSSLTANTLTLCAHPFPTQPVIYRIARWLDSPATVSTVNESVRVNQGWGAPVPSLSSEAAVDASQGGWFFDTANHRLIVKEVKGGSGCSADTYFPLLLFNIP